MLNNRELQEYYEWEKEKNSFMTNFKKTLSPVTVIGFLALILVAYWMINNSKINPMYLFIPLGVIIIIVFFKADKVRDKQPIPDHIMEIIGTSLMRRKIGTVYPIGTIINPNGYGRIRWMGEWGQAFNAWKWEQGFNIIYPDGRRKTIKVIFEPFEGYITGKVGCPAGYNGEESTDLKVLMPLQLAVKDEGAKK